ncbi:MAG: hypothetical protein ACREX3_21960, partial [Gammaproteobacteria bacterium]
MAIKRPRHQPRKREIPIETIVTGMQPSNGILQGLKKKLSIREVSSLASSLRQLRNGGKGIILRCRETFPYMIPVLSEVDGIISPNTSATTKGHSAEFCREEGKTFVVADERAWCELEVYEGESILVDPLSKKIILRPAGRPASTSNAGYAPRSEIKVIGELIKEGRHISLLSTVPEHINPAGKFSYFCRQEQLMMSKGKTPWDLLTRNRQECEQILHGIWSDYASKVQPGVVVVFRSHDARSDEY